MCHFSTTPNATVAFFHQCLRTPPFLDIFLSSAVSRDFFHLVLEIIYSLHCCCYSAIRTCYWVFISPPILFISNNLILASVLLTTSAIISLSSSNILTKISVKLFWGFADLVGLDWVFCVFIHWLWWAPASSLPQRVCSIPAVLEVNLCCRSPRDIKLGLGHSLFCQSSLSDRKYNCKLYEMWWVELSSGLMCSHALQKMWQHRLLNMAEIQCRGY